MPDRTGRPPLSRHSYLPWVVFLSYALLMASWIAANPPYGGPDEWSHYLRAVSLGHGQLLGAHSGKACAAVELSSVQPFSR